VSGAERRELQGKVCGSTGPPTMLCPPLNDADKERRKSIIAKVGLALEVEMRSCFRKAWSCILADVCR
jgi:hypothetical protein